MSLKIEIQCANITEISVDVIILKFAQELYGADKLIVKILSKKDKNIRELAIPIGEHSIFHTFGKIKAESVVFVGVQELYKFRYGNIREFSREALNIIGVEFPNIKTIAMTIHGIGAGLDEEECFLSQLGGFLDALREGLISSNLEKIIIVEINEKRAKRLEKLLIENVTPEMFKRDQKIIPDSKVDQKIQKIDETGEQSETKPHIFVAMPFAKKFIDVYEFGIKMPVKAAGFVCERIDETYFSGSIFERIKSRIETSKAVIADLSGANPNVYLEVGYALGKDLQTILLVDDANSLAFDAKDQRCLVYDSIVELKEKLEREIQEILI